MFPMNPFSLILAPPPVGPSACPDNARDVPARVRFALEYLQSLTVKTMERPVVWESGYDTVPGQALTKAELNAQASAANVINDYFNGRLDLDRFEAMDRVDKETPLEGGCPLKCGRMESCPACKGSGKVLIYPLRGKE